MYYNMLRGDGDDSESGLIVKKFGVNWMRNYIIDWKKFPKLISSNLSRQIFSRTDCKRLVDVVRTSVFTSLRNDTLVGSPREKMLEDFYKANFDVHK
jgi:hypothetical protein